MSLYPSLEDMTVGKMAQVSYRMQIEIAPLAMRILGLVSLPRVERLNVLSSDPLHNEICGFTIIFFCGLALHSYWRNP